MNGNPAARIEGRQIASRPLRIRLFTRAWQGEQHGEVLPGKFRYLLKTRLKKAVYQSIVSFV
jgi:hypothetical protein